MEKPIKIPKTNFLRYAHLANLEGLTEIPIKKYKKLFKSRAKIAPDIFEEISYKGVADDKHPEFPKTSEAQNPSLPSHLNFQESDFSDPNDSKSFSDFQQKPKLSFLPFHRPHPTFSPQSQQTALENLEKFPLPQETITPIPSIDDHTTKIQLWLRDPPNQGYTLTDFYLTRRH